MKRLRITLEIPVSEMLMDNGGVTDELLIKNTTVTARELAHAVAMTAFMPGSGRSAEALFNTENAQMFMEVCLGSRRNDGLDEIRERVREELDTNGEMVYGMSKAEIKDICSTNNDILEWLTEASYETMADAEVTMDEAVDRVVGASIQRFLLSYRAGN